VWERFKTQLKKKEKGAEHANLKLNLNPLLRGAQGISEVTLVLSHLVTTEQQPWHPMKRRGKEGWRSFMFIFISQLIKFHYKLIFTAP